LASPRARLKVGHTDVTAGIDVDAWINDVRVVSRADVALVSDHGICAAHVDAVPAGIVLCGRGTDRMAGHNVVVEFRGLLDAPVGLAISSRRHNRRAVRLLCGDWT